MAETLKESKDTPCTHDVENPMESCAFTTCLEEKKFLLKSYQRRRYFGKHIPLLWRNNEPWLTLGPQWPLFLLTWCGLVSIGIFIVYHVPWAKSPNFKIAAGCFTAWQALIYLMTSLKNPGIVTNHDINESLVKNEESQQRFCKICKVATNKDYAHCVDCKVCIKGYDHHCPWTGKCIGAGNWWQFYTFLFSTFAYIVFWMQIWMK